MCGDIFRCWCRKFYISEFSRQFKLFFFFLQLIKMTQAFIDFKFAVFAQNSHTLLPIEVSILVYIKIFEWLK